MNRIRESVSDFLSGRRFKRIRAALASVTAAAVMFSVTASLIRPAVSVTENELVEVVKRLDDGGGSPLVIYGVSDSTQTGVYSVTALVTKDQNDSEGHKKFCSSLSASFMLKSEDVQTLSSHSNSIQFKLWDQMPDQLEIDPTMNLNGDVYSSGGIKEKIGTYVFDPVSGDVVITFDFTAQYFADRQGESISGGFDFQAWVWHEDDSTEDISYQIAGNDVKVPIYRYTHSPDLAVKKSYNNDFFYPTEGYTMGMGDQAQRMLGSSFKINVKSVNGVDGKEVSFTDTLTSSNVHFDLNPGASWPLYASDGSPATGVTLKIESITSEDGSEVLSARIIADDEETLKKGFEYYWNCPVTVNSTFLDSNGAVDTEKLRIIEGQNNVAVKAHNVPQKTSDANIQVNLIADIAKNNGSYDPETNTVTWSYTIYKDNGYWRYAKVEAVDLIGGENGTPPEIVPDSVKLRVVPAGGGTPVEVGDTQTLGVNPIQYDSSTGKFTITMAEDDVQYGGITYNKTAIQEFLIEYKTPVTASDYGSTINNWIGLVDPDAPPDAPTPYNDVDSTKHAVIINPTVSKDYTLGETGITWTVKVDNRDGQNLAGLVIRDSITDPDNTVSYPDFTDAAANVTVNGLPLSLAGILTASGNTLTFNTDAVYNAESYTITYYQEIGDLTPYRNKEFSNTAELKNDTGTLSTATKEAHIPKQFEIEKQGSLGADGKMHYTVSYINQYGADLNDQVITDVLTITDSSGQPVDANGFNITVVDSTVPVLYSVNKIDNVLTTNFQIQSSTTVQRVDVEYTLTLADTSKDFRSQYGYKVRNTADWNDETDTVQTDIERYVTLGNKSGSYIRENNTIEWTILINNPYGVDLGTFPTADSPYTLTDSMFGQGRVRSLTVTDAQGNDVTDAGDLAAVNSGTDYTFKEGMTSAQYTLKYVTKYENTDPVTNWNRAVEETNTVRYGGDEPIETTVTANAGDTNKYLYKNCSPGDADGTGKFVLSWNFELGTYSEGFIDSMERGDAFTDTIGEALLHRNADNSTEALDELRCYMTPDQFSLDRFEIDLISTANNWQSVMGDADPAKMFELTATEYDGDYITAFTLTFKQVDEGTPEYLALQSADKLKVAYDSTAEGAQLISEPGVMDNNDYLRFENTVEFPDRIPVTKTHDITKRTSIVKRYTVKDEWGNYYETWGEPKLKLSELEKSGDGYDFSYRLHVNDSRSFDNTTDILLKDALPKNMILVSGTYYTANNYNDVRDITVGDPAGDTVTCKQEGRSLDFHVPAAVHGGGKVTIDYILHITEADLNEALLDTSDGTVNGTAKLENTVMAGTDFDSVAVTVTDDAEYITKNAAQARDRSDQPIPNAVTYTLDINPNARNIIPEGMTSLQVEDTINLVEDGSGRYAEYPIFFEQLDPGSIRVYSVDANDNETELDPTKFGMSVPVKETLPVKDRAGSYGDVYTFSLRIPDETHLRIVYDYAFEFSTEARNDDTFSTETMQLKNKAVINGRADKAENSSNFDFNKFQTSGAYAKAVPDITLKKVSSDNSRIKLGGAQFILRRYNTITGKWETLVDVEPIEDLFAENEDHSKDDPLGNAVFGVWADSETNPTPYAGLVTVNDPESSSFGQLTLPNLQSYETKTITLGNTQTERKYYIPLTRADGQQACVYELTEVRSPTGYYFDEGSKDYYFYEMPKDAEIDEARPVKAITDGGLSDMTVNMIRSGTAIELANNPMELDVEKTWEDQTSANRPESIAVELWQSDDPPEASVYHKVTLNAINKGLGDELNSRIFYCKDSEVFTGSLLYEYSGYYRMDAFDTDGLHVEAGFVNSNGEVEYRISSRNAITEDAVFSVDIYQSSNAFIDFIATSATAPANNNGMDASAVKIAEGTLTAENGWKYSFDATALDSSKYYFVKEVVPEGYKAYYQVNGINTGVMKITNVLNETGSLTVNKSWLTEPPDGVDEVTFDIYGCTEKLEQSVSNYRIVNSTVVKATVKDLATPEETRTVYYLASKDSTSYITVKGRSAQDWQLWAHTVNGETFNSWENGNRIAVSGGFKFRVPTIPGENGIVEVVITYQQLSDSGIFEITAEDIDGLELGIMTDEPVIPEEDDDGYSAAEVNYPDSYLVHKELTVDRAHNWTGTLDGLFVTYDDNGEEKPIYYYAVEKGSSKYIPIDYSTNGVALKPAPQQSVTVLNQPDDTPAYELPETGGSGTANCIAAGAGIMFGAAIYYLITRRKSRG